MGLFWSGSQSVVYNAYLWGLRVTEIVVCLEIFCVLLVFTGVNSGVATIQQQILKTSIL